MVVNELPANAGVAASVKIEKIIPAPECPGRIIYPDGTRGRLTEAVPPEAEESVLAGGIYSLAELARVQR